MKYWDGTSKQSKRANKTWIIPHNQVVEFMSGPINYRKLIEDCLKEMEHKKTRIRMKRKVF